MTYINVSFTHKNTDLSIRERLSFNSDEKKHKFLSSLKTSNNISECMILSTCNRVEVLAYVDDVKLASDFIILEISSISNVSFDDLNKRADVYENTSAIHHLFSVASSLDSLVVGETQIVGQLKDAFNFAKKSNYCSKFLQIAIDASFKCAAKIRNETLISKNPVSISSVAVSLAKEQLGSLDGIKALVIGAGEMSELVCKNLINSKADITLINRTKEKAINLANKLSSNIKVNDFSKLDNELKKNVVIFSATSSADPIITNKNLSGVNFKRYFFDIAVPRDINISSNSMNLVFAVDDLDSIVKRNLSLREEEASKAYLIVSDDINKFFDNLKQNQTIPAIKAIRKSAKDVCEIELAKAIKKGYLKNSDLNEARKFLNQVFKAFLHTPTINLKKSDESKIKTIIDFFGLNKEFNDYKKGDIDEI